MTFKKGDLFILILVVVSCNSVNEIGINSSIKRIHYSGIQTGQSYIDYEVEFTSKHNFTIENIKLNDNEIIVDYDLLSFQENKYINNSDEYEKGKYLLSFKNSGVKSIDNEDFILLAIRSNHKIQFTKMNVEKLKPFRAK
jgi:hypothetical protein